MKKALIMYGSLFGNTQEVAEIIEQGLVRAGVEVTMYRAGMGLIPSPSDYDVVLFGTYTWNKGAVPDEVKDLVYDIGYKPGNVLVFGTGDTQFGGKELFCRAVDKLSRFYESQHPPLKIEQSPRGAQEEIVEDWVAGVLSAYGVQEYAKVAI